MIDISGREFGIKLGHLFGIRISIAFGFSPLIFCMVLLEQKPQWLPCNLRFLNVNGLTQFTPMDMTLSFWLRNLLNQNMQSA